LAARRWLLLALPLGADAAVATGLALLALRQHCCGASTVDIGSGFVMAGAWSARASIPGTITSSRPSATARAIWATRLSCFGGKRSSTWSVGRPRKVAPPSQIDRALEARLLQRDAGRTDLVDRVVLVEGVGRAWQLLTGRPLGRSLTVEQRPSGPGLRLVRICLEPLDPLVTDDAIVWAIRRAQDQPW
jgi:hypothetical protein